MKSAIKLSSGAEDSVTVKNAIRSAYDIKALPRLVADWNLNRYTNPTVKNTPDELDEGFDIESYPLESIVEPLRPTKGLAKARVNEAVVSSRYKGPSDPKFYVSDPNDTYKYWTSPEPTDSTGVFSLHTDGITKVRPQVDYDRVVKANKIVIKTENTWATPATYNVLVSNSIGSPPSVVGGSNPAINLGDGTITLYYNGVAWVSSRPEVLHEGTDIASIQFRVESMTAGRRSDGTVMTYTKKNVVKNTDGKNSSFNLIAIEAHLEVDLTDRLISTSDNFDMGDKSELYPIGTITTNTAELTLSNEDGIFSQETGGRFEGLMEPNVEFNLEYIYHLNGEKYSVQQYRMYGAGWPGDEDGTVSVSLEDYSKFLKEIKPRPFMIENTRSTELVWRVLDSVGFVDYDIDVEDLSDDSVISVFWTDGEKTVWEVLDELAQATQTAIYMDERGRLQVRCRAAALKETHTIDWSLLGVTSGGDLADIISWSPSGEYTANKFTVTYRAAKWKVNSLGKAAMSKIWEPESKTLTLRSAPLRATLGVNGMKIWLRQKEAAVWPYKSKVQIDGEIIQYEGKEFVYYKGGVANKVVVKTKEEYNKFNNKTPPANRAKNYFTGALIVTERAIWNTSKIGHPIDLNGWTTKHESSTPGGGFGGSNNVPGLIHNKKNSTVTINTPNYMKNANHIFWATRGGSGTPGYRMYGTRFKFAKDKSNTTQIAGLGYQLSGTREAGYYIQIRPTVKITPASRKTVNEVVIVSRAGGGKETIISKGVPCNIAKGVWYDLDVYHTGSGNNQRIVVWLNGMKVAQATTNSNTARADSGKFGFFAKGKTMVRFEYIYALQRPTPEPADSYGFWDLKYGGIRGDSWEREAVYNTRTRWKKIKKKKSRKITERYKSYVFDEFGPYVHEIREFDVKFDPAPVRYSYLFNTNEWYSAVLEYTSTPFDAQFSIANVSRAHAVIHGEDRLTFAGASSGGINQVCTVLGQNLELSDDETVTEENEFAIRKRGVIESELSNQWIQSKSQAETLAKWMSKHWSESVDEVEVEVFGNPLLQIGDLVDVHYPTVNAYPETHQYFVLATRTTFDSGISTSLTLRRRRLSD